MSEDSATRAVEPPAWKPGNPTWEAGWDSLAARIRPRAWTREMHDAWHRALPDVPAAFDALILAMRPKPPTLPERTDGA